MGEAPRIYATANHTTLNDIVLAVVFNRDAATLPEANRQDANRSPSATNLLISGRSSAPSGASKRSDLETFREEVGST